MKKFIANKIFILILIAVAIIGLGRLTERWRHNERIATSPVLTQAEKSKVIIDASKNKVTIVRRDGDKQVITEVSGSRKVSVTVTKDGELKVYAPTKGFIFEPGILFAQDEGGTMLGLDAQVFYWRKTGLLAGLSAPPRRGLLLQDIRAHVALGYNLADVKMANTNVFVGYNTKKSIMVGLRVRF